MDITDRPDHLTVVADHNPGVHTTDSDEFWWWLPSLGPTSTLLAFLLARHATYGETTWDTTELARTIGLAGNLAKLWNSIERLAVFGIATFVSTDVIAIRLQLPALSYRQIETLPTSLASTYRHRRAA